MRNITLLNLMVLFLGCQNPDTLVNKADGTISGRVLPGEAAGVKGVITVVAASTNELDVIDWTHKRDILNQFGEYEIEELVGGKYYIAAYLDMNGDGQFNQGDYWGGYDANGDGRLDPVTLDGGKRLVVDIAFIGKVS